MVCILCDSKTKTSNSRSNSDHHQTWRRHTCKRCSAVFTTRETIDMAISYRVEQVDGSIRPFSRDTLFLSVLEALKHRPSHIEDAAALTLTIISKVQSLRRLIIGRDELFEISASVLRRYNIGVSQIYKSRHSK